VPSPHVRPHRGMLPRVSLAGLRVPIREVPPYVVLELAMYVSHAARRAAAAFVLTAAALIALHALLA